LHHCNYLSILSINMDTPRKAVEKNLSEIAFASLAEKSPSLMDYYLGFDLIEKNDAGTRAAGLMGFKIGKQLLYVPIFFLNGKVKGTEVMYLKNSDVFVNNTEQWVSYIIGQAQQDIGTAKKEDENKGDGGEMARSLSLFQRPPSSAMKTASIFNHSPDPTKTASVVGSFDDYSVDDFIDKDILSNPPRMGLTQFIKKAGADNFQKIASILTKKEVWNCVTQIYSPEELKITFQQVKQAAEVKAEEVKKVQIIKLNDENIFKSASNLTKEEKSKFFTNGYIIKNAFEGDAATKMYIEDEKDTFQEVTESGIYNILTVEGKLTEAFVFVGCLTMDAIGTSRGGTRFKFIRSKSGVSHTSTIDGVYYRASRDQKLGDDFRKSITDGGKPFSSIAVGKSYIMVGDDFSSYGSFTVKNKSTENGKTTLSIMQDYCRCCMYGGSDRLNLRHVDLDGKLERAGNTIYVTNEYKFLEIDAYHERDKDEDINLLPGDFSTVVDALSHKGGLKAIFEKSNKDVKVSVEGKTASFNDRGDFVFYLCDTMRLPVVSSEKLASRMFDDGSLSMRAVFMPKIAYPVMQDPATDAGVTRAGIPQEMQGSETQQMVEPTPQGPPATDQQFGSWDGPSKEDMEMLERAADSDSREVFDPAMIGILVRTTRSEAMVQEYIPEFVDNLDRMIRLLLLFYWHNADFAENYGIDEMAKFEDLLLSTIKTTGKTILFLKQKSVESSSGSTDVL